MAAMAAPEGHAAGGRDLMAMDAEDMLFLKRLRSQVKRESRQELLFRRCVGRLELSEQELLFQRALQGRLEGEAVRSWQLQERQQAAELMPKEALESAYAHRVEDLLCLLGKGCHTETADLHGNSLLSEAAVGGAEDCVQALLAYGANPNSLGRSRRTPLWRAANAGHAEVVRLLLRGGADPQIRDQDACRPFDLANGPEIRLLLQSWDIRLTESLRAAFVANLRSQERERRAKQAQQAAELQEALEQAQRKVRIAEAEALRLQEVLDGCMRRGELPTSAQTAQLERSEAQLECALRIHRGLEWQAKRARLKLEDFAEQLRRDTGEVGPSRIVPLRNLVQVVVKDLGGQRREDGRWPLVFDESGGAMAFFKYSETASTFEAAELALWASSQSGEEQERLALTLLRQLSQGGQLVIHLGASLEALTLVEDAFNALGSGLFLALTDRSVLYSYLLTRRFLSMVPGESSVQYCEASFDDERLATFVLVFVVTGEAPLPETVERECHAFYTVIVRSPKELMELAEGDS